MRLLNLHCALVALSPLFLFGAKATYAQEPDTSESLPTVCTDGKIARVVVENHSVFDAEDMAASNRFAGIYRFANRIHFTTRPSVLRREILISEGDCYDPLLVSESGRLLRRLSFIAEAEAEAERRIDGDWDVVVTTKDEWTTEINVVTNFEEGFEFRGFDVTEESVLGSGVRLTGFYLERDQVKDLGIDIQTPNLFSRVDSRVAFGSTRSGHFLSEGLFYPFLGEVGQFAFRQVYSRREGQFSYSIPGSSPFSTRGVLDFALLPHTREQADVTLGWRLGQPGEYTVLGFGFSRESYDFVSFPQSIQLASGGNFADADDAGPEFEGEVARQATGRATTRMNFLFGRRRVSFVQRKGLDSLEGIEDVAVGSNISLLVGPSIHTAIRGGNGLEANGDIFSRLSLFQGFAPENWVISLSGSIEGRKLTKGVDGPEWRDVITEADAYLYWSPEESNYTTFGRLSYAGGWTMDSPFQLTLGGPYSVRGFREEDFPGARRVVMTLEERIDFNWPAPRAFDMGMTLFSDAGQIWSGDAPFAQESGFEVSVGGGLRFGFPQGNRKVIRVDVVTPVTGDLAFNDFILRISFGELVGLGAGVSDIQVGRSRRSGISSNLSTVPWVR